MQARIWFSTFIVGCGLALGSAPVANAMDSGGIGQPGNFTFETLDGPNGIGVGGNGGYVNVASGNFLLQRDDVAPTTGNYGVRLTRTYNSLAPATGTALSSRWNFSADTSVRVTTSANGATVVAPDGAPVRFSVRADGTYVDEGSAGAQLVKRFDGGWDFQQPVRGEVVRYDSYGRVAESQGPGLATLTASYTSANGSERIGSVGTNDGRRANFSYRGDGRVIEVDDPASGHTMYGYAATGSLESVRSAVGIETRFAYDTGGRVGRVIAGADSLELSYDANGRVTAATVEHSGDERTWSFRYQSGRTLVTRPGAAVVAYYYDAHGTVTSVDASPDASGDVNVAADAGSFDTPTVDYTVSLPVRAARVRIDLHRVELGDSETSDPDADAPPPVSDVRVKSEVQSLPVGNSAASLNLDPVPNQDGDRSGIYYLAVRELDDDGNTVGHDVTAYFEYIDPQSLEDDAADPAEDQDDPDAEIRDSFKENVPVSPEQLYGFSDDVIGANDQPVARAAAPLRSCTNARVRGALVAGSSETIAVGGVRRKSKKRTSSGTITGRIMEWNIKITNAAIARRGLVATTLLDVRMRINGKLLRRDYRVPRVAVNPGYRFHEAKSRFVFNDSRKQQHSFVRGERLGWRGIITSVGAVATPRGGVRTSVTGSIWTDCQIY